MTAIFAARALLPEGWADNVVVRLEAGAIRSAAAGAAAPPDAVRVDALLPAPANVHSHSFQRAMAGMTGRAARRDDFWSWRAVMYRFADRLRPEEIEAIAAYAFVEMLEAGYAAVAEFHYLHHQPGGAPYAAIDELSQRILAAAARAGIGLTLLPVFYAHGGADKRPLADEQKRFGNDVDRYWRIVEAARANKAIAGPDCIVGLAPHSLRAAAPDDIRRLIAADPQGPIHIHAAEQEKEVAEVEAALGARPVAYLLDSLGADRRWCLVHATQMTDDETRRLAASGAVAGLCPVTEADLGDGPFNGAAYLAANGAFAIGTDSNVRISLADELRLFEYAQRLSARARNILAAEGESVGERLYRGAAAGGAQALQRRSGAIAEGRLADLIALDGASPALCALDAAQLIDGFCFAGGAPTDVWSAGRRCVQGGRHVARDAIFADYRRAVAGLLARL
jgi:formiminoglutamate deiminase